MQDFFYYFWGPLLARTTVSENFLKTFGNCNLSEPANQSLAGQIKSEFYYPKEFVAENSGEIIEKLHKYFELLLGNWRMVNHVHPFSIEIRDIWLNIQKSGEFNPIHNHNTDLSFVIYLDIPEEIYDEPHNTQSTPPGTIEWRDKLIFDPYPSDTIHSLLRPISAVNEKPKTGDMFIFPAYLYHHVQKFDSNVERKTIAGNVSLINT